MAGLRRALAGAVHRWRGWRGNVDGVQDGALLGWVALTDPAAGPQPVGLFTARGQIASTVANLPREDLRAAGIGNGQHGFAFPLDAATLRVIAEAGNRVSLRLLGPHPARIGGWDLSAGRRGSLLHAASVPPAQTLPQLLYGPVTQLSGVLDEVRGAGAMPGSHLPRLDRHGVMLAPRNLVPGTGLGATLPQTMTAYGDYVRFRFRQDWNFDLPDAPDIEAEHYLQWFLAVYLPVRQGLRVPLSAAQIAHLNAPVLIGGQRTSLTRATWMFLHTAPQICQSMDFGNEDWVNWAVYWWAFNRARQLNVEDCLVPQGYVDRLRRVPVAHAGQDWALSEFMLRLRNESPALMALNLEDEADRRRLTLAVMTLAVQRPDYLRYVPADSVEAVLARAADGGCSLLGAFLAEMAGEGAAAGDISEEVASPLTALARGGPAARARYHAESVSGTTSGPVSGSGTDGGKHPAANRAGAPPAVSSLAALDRDDFARVLRLSGFDLDSRSFLAFTPEGHRFEAAMLPVPQGEAVDVQVIGPFEKASGLGQATRLSAAALTAAGFSPNCVDFDLDNPAPEGFSRVGRLDRYRPARVNLIHLNAELIPLAFAYQPDVFSGAWNIGYFYWELDSPAACHYLALELLDEIWVSSDYGVQIYRPHTRLPVTNVGMCYEEPPQISRTEARAFLARRCGVRDEFTFLVAFDSFSFIQRKNPLAPLRAFLDAFAGRTDVHMVIKTQNRRKVGDPPQVAIWSEIDRLTAGDPRFTVLDETLSYDDLLRLKKGCDAYVSLHRSEGWGFGMIEAMALGVPVVATGYSGNMEFCSEETAFLVDYTEVELERDNYIFVRPGQKWADPDLDHAARQMRAVCADAALREARVEAALRNVRENFSAGAIGARYGARLRAILAAGQAAPARGVYAAREGRS